MHARAQVPVAPQGLKCPKALWVLLDRRAYLGRVQSHDGAQVAVEVGAGGRQLRRHEHVHRHLYWRERIKAPGPGFESYVWPEAPLFTGVIKAKANKQTRMQTDTCVCERIKQFEPLDTNSE